MMIRRIIATIAIGIALTVAGWHISKAATDVQWTGTVGHHIDVVSNTPAVQAAAYASGDVIGGKQTLTVFRGVNQGTVIRSILITSKVAIATGFDLVFFSSDPSGSTFTENGAISIAAADAPKVIGIATVTTLLALGTPSSAQLSGLNMPIVGDGTTRTIWVVMIAKGATTPTGTADIQLRLGVEEN